ncbi:hypothetical protein CFC21_108503, partial [Triticum aestivum]
GQPEERGRRAAHALWRLVIHELQVPHRVERFGHPMKCVLWHQPVHGQRGRPSVGGSPGHGGLPAVALDEARDERGRHGDGEPDAHAVEEGDATVQARAAAGQRDERTVI